MDQLQNRLRLVGPAAGGAVAALTVSRASRWTATNSPTTPSTAARLTLSAITFSWSAARHRPRRPTNDPKNLRNLDSNRPRSTFVTDTQTLTTRPSSSSDAVASTVARRTLRAAGPSPPPLTYNITNTTVNVTATATAGLPRARIRKRRPPVQGNSAKTANARAADNAPHATAANTPSPLPRITSTISTCHTITVYASAS